ncbi:site-specific integrase [candidate division NPL-UPA2 bacterium]|nr:site-specific integrase [candidate division NPL-UPA2 bacterium]
MRGHVRRKGNLWYVVLELERDQEGKRVQKTLSVRAELGLSKRATKRQAEELLIQKLKELQDGTYFEPTEITLADFLEKWLDNYASGNVKQKTLDSYKNTIYNHIIPEIGPIHLKKLRPLHVQSLLSSKQKTGRADGKEGGLSNTSIRYIHVIIKLALSHAVKWELVPRNIADMVLSPKIQNAQIQYWTKEETRKFLKTIKEHRLYPLYLLAITTGMRRGEILGLRWQDINLKKDIVRINQTLLNTTIGDIIQDSAKTDGSKRTLDISPTVSAELSRHRKKQAEEFTVLGQPEKDFDLVFTSKAGTPFSPRNLNRNFNLLVKKTGLKPITFHGLRHTYATLMLTEYGQDITTVSARLGHAKVTVTYEKYSHIIPKKQKEAALKTDDLIE